MSKEIWALIDLENVGSTLKDIPLSRYSKVFIFVGARQNNLSLQSISVDKLTEITILKIREVSDNNLDFHISYYLGRFDALEKKEISFAVISNDKGYDNLIKHINHNGRKCVRVGKSISTNQTLEPEDKKIVVKIINTDYKKLPKTEASLKNVIKSHLGDRSNTNNINKIYNMLIKDELIKSRILSKELA
jgi:hypothetical protein